MTTSLGSPLARGRYAEVYVWDAAWVIKLFHPDYPQHRIESESTVTQRVHAAGLGTPAVGGIVTVESRLGILYEYIKGSTLLKILLRHPVTSTFKARLLADLHVRLHSHRLTELPEQRARLTQNIHAAAVLPSHMREAVLELLSTLPDADFVCHGDWHPGNIIVTDAGPIIIDWGAATQGNPLADVAQTLVVMRAFNLPEHTPGRRRIEAGRWWLSKLYRRRYMKLVPEAESELTAWQLVMAAAAMPRSQASEQKRLLRLIQTGLWQRSSTRGYG